MIRPNRINAMRMGQMNVRGLGLGKYEDMCKELEEQYMDVVAVTDTSERLWMFEKWKI